MTHRIYEQPMPQVNDTPLSEQQIVTRGLRDYARVIRDARPAVTYPAVEPLTTQQMDDTNPYIADGLAAIDALFAQSFEDSAKRAQEAGKPAPNTLTY